MIDRRNFLAGVLAFSATGARADDQNDYIDYPFVDFFSIRTRGPSHSPPPDVAAATRIASLMPSDNHYRAMKSLSEITETGSTGEAFNSRWKKVANPLIVLFFHEIGYTEKQMPDDCTPWCAATVAWCLKRTGMSIPSNPALVRSYLHYGNRVDDPMPGDLCIFSGVNNVSLGHMGVYVSHVRDKVRILGGNQAGHAATECKPGYLQSKICTTEIPINSDRSPSVSVLYLSAYVRPV